MKNLFEREKSYPPDWSSTSYKGVYAVRAEQCRRDGKHVRAKELDHLHRQETGWDGIDFPALTERTRNYGHGALKNALDLPQHLFWAAEHTVAQVQAGDISHVYHGTRFSRLGGILKEGGMKAFAEGQDASGGSIFGCANALEAAHHAFTRGPEDTKRGDFTSRVDAGDPVVILKIEVAKLGLSDTGRSGVADYVKNYNEALGTGDRWKADIMGGVKIGDKIPMDAIRFLSLDQNGSIVEQPLSNLGITPAATARSASSHDQPKRTNHAAPATQFPAARR